MNPTASTETRTAPRTQARRRFVLVAIVAPLVFIAAVAAAQFISIPDLGATVPTHWGGDGKVDGWGPAWMNPVLTAAVSAGTVLLLGILGLSGAGQASGSGAGQRLRFLAASTVFSGVFLSLCIGLSAGEDENLGPRLLIGFLAGAAAGGLAAWWAYRVTWDVAGEDVPVRPDPVPLAEGEHRTWERRLTMGKLGWVLNVGSFVLAVGVVIMGLIRARTDPDASAAELWILFGVAALILAAFPALTSARATVDADGLRVRGALGWPRLSVKTADVESAEVLPVSALGQFGGWGWRYMPGSGWGVIMGSGEALAVTKKNRGQLTVTTPDAASAAALLNAYAQRADS